MNIQPHRRTSGALIGNLMKKHIQSDTESFINTPTLAGNISTLSTPGATKRYGKMKHRARSGSDEMLAEETIIDDTSNISPQSVQNSKRSRRQSRKTQEQISFHRLVTNEFQRRNTRTAQPRKSLTAGAHIFRKATQFIEPIEYLNMLKRLRHKLKMNAGSIDLEKFRLDIEKRKEIVVRINE